MIQSAAFQRKILYLGLIAILLVPLYMIGHPAAGDPASPDSTPGGQLAQLRSDYDLSQAELGEIDPASETMKLATLGLKGVAAQILWTKANNYKKTENWDGMIAAVKQMAKLQPNFITVWEFQSHNLSYNISVEQDDYRFRYLWVKKGIEFLIQGTKYNRKEPRLFWTVGWYNGQKFGRADEYRQFRSLFREDHDFHDSLNEYVAVDAARGADGNPDNWLVARLWFNDGYNLVDTQGARLRGKSPHIFFADGPKSLMNYAGAIESEGYLDEKAEYAWQTAGEEWTEFGDRQVPTSQGLIIRLNDEEAMAAEVGRLTKELDELVPGIREEIVNERLAKMSSDELQALETPLEEVEDEETYFLKLDAQAKLVVQPEQIAELAPENKKARAYKLAEQINEAAENADWVDRYRENVNFEYWRTRCEVEQKPEAVKARRHIYTANRLTEQVEHEAARKEFEAAWNEWDKILKANPALMGQLMADDLLEDVQKYIELLGQLDEKLPADFKLRRLLELHNALPEHLRRAADPANAGPASSTTAEPPATDADESKSVPIEDAPPANDSSDKDESNSGDDAAEEENNGKEGTDATS